jgi:hypothetical protein
MREEGGETPIALLDYVDEMSMEMPKIFDALRALQEM